jgi:outer membrane cobalamin receptor
MGIIVSATVILSLGLAGAGQQQPAVRETVVVTATAAPDSLQNIGRTVVVLTGDELRQLPVVSIADALRLVSSVDVRSRGPLGVQSDVSVRGAGFGQALVLVDGVRINDAQSGHHNSDIPVPFDEIDRVEVLLGGGSSLHGADATGGAVNVITRGEGRRLSADLAAGQYGLFETAATAAISRGGIQHVLSGTFSRSDGFMPARDHTTGLGRYQATFGRMTSATLGFLDKAFGANGFYGPAPSREWTDQWLGTFRHRIAHADRWQASADASYRTHGDRFVYDERNPSLSQSRHRTHAIAANVRWHGAVAPGTQMSVVGSGGHETIASTNLGDRSFSRGSAGVEIRQSVGPNVVLHPGLRVDGYSRFGTSWSPSLAFSGWINSRVRVRSSAGHAFRVPTFTELFYVDPNHQAAGALDPETAWSADAGMDAYGGPWTMGMTVFGRWEENVIDWVRPSTAVRWRTSNIRHVDTRGVETSAQRRFGGRAQLRVQYTWLTSEAPALDLLSKYALDYARQSAAASGATGWHRMRLAARAEWKRRVDGRNYWTMDMQVARAVRRAEIYLQVANLFDRRYQEIRGVDMPGRWVKAGCSFRL